MGFLLCNFGDLAKWHFLNKWTDEWLNECTHKWQSWQRMECENGNNSAANWRETNDQTTICQRNRTKILFNGFLLPRPFSWCQLMSSSSAGCGWWVNFFATKKKTLFKNFWLFVLFGKWNWRCKVQIDKSVRHSIGGTEFPSIRIRSPSTCENCSKNFPIQRYKRVNTMKFHFSSSFTVVPIAHFGVFNCSRQIDKNFSIFLLVFPRSIRDPISAVLTHATCFSTKRHTHMRRDMSFVADNGRHSVRGTERTWKNETKLHQDKKNISGVY